MKVKLSEEQRNELLEHLQLLADEAVTHGVEEAHVVAVLAEVLDAMIPMDSFVPDPWGKVAEAVDDRVIVWILNAAIHNVLTADPKRILDRAARARAKGHDKLADFREARAARVLRRMQQSREGKPEGKTLEALDTKDLAKLR